MRDDFQEGSLGQCYPQPFTPALPPNKKKQITKGHPKLFVPCFESGSTGVYDCGKLHLCHGLKGSTPAMESIAPFCMDSGFCIGIMSWPLLNLSLWIHVFRITKHWLQLAWGLYIISTRGLVDFISGVLTMAHMKTAICSGCGHR